MALDPNYATKTSAAIATTGAVATTVIVRAASSPYPVDQTACKVGTKRYEVDHVDGDGKTRTPDDVAAIIKQLMYDGGHATK